MATTQSVALVTGSSGLVGRHLIKHLDALPGWKVYAVCRKELDYGKELKKCSEVRVGNLLDGNVAKADLAHCKDVTHIFHCALAWTNDLYKDAEENLALLKNVVEGVEASSGKLQHVYVQTGTKYYGMNFGPFPKSPAREDDPRTMTPNFYYDMMDYLSARQQAGATWSWSELRPNPVIGFSPASPMNLILAIGVYGTLCAQLGLPFRFPGSRAAYEVAMEVCDVDLLAEAIIFTSTQPQARNHAFNVSNGDVFRWSEVWPKLAPFFGLPVAPPQKVSLAATMTTPDKQRAWDQLVKHHGLQHQDLAKLVSWIFADQVFGLEEDSFATTNKLRRAGFHSMHLDTDAQLLAKLQQLRDLKVIP